MLTLLDGFTCKYTWLFQGIELIGSEFRGGDIVNRIIFLQDEITCPQDVSGGCDLKKIQIVLNQQIKNADFWDLSWV